MVEIVIPLGIEAEAPELTGTNDAAIVEGALGDAIDPPVELFGAPPERQAQLFEEGPGRVIENSMDGVKAQSVDLELADPEQGVIDEEAPNLIAMWAVEVERRTPRSLVALREIGTELCEIVTLRAQVVIDDIEDDS